MPYELFYSALPYRIEWYACVSIHSLFRLTLFISVPFSNIFTIYSFFIVQHFVCPYCRYSYLRFYFFLFHWISFLCCGQHKFIFISYLDTNFYKKKIVFSFSSVILIFSVFFFPFIYCFYN